MWGTDKASERTHIRILDDASAPKGQMINKGMMSSNTDLWATPQEFFDKLNDEFHFDLDVCALPTNTKCSRYFTPEQDGLTREWRGTCYMNPPYGRQIIHWVRKAYESAQGGVLVVGLLPARTCAKWFHEYIYGKAEIRFVRGRIKYGGAKWNAPFPSMIVIWRANKQGARVI